MPRPSFLLFLRTLHGAIWLCLVAYVIWQLTHGQHVGDDGIAGLFALTALGIAIGAYRRRKVR